MNSPLNGFKPIIIIAGGPSLIREDIEYAEKQNVDILGINDAYRICNRLNYLYACDRRWWNWHWTRVNEIKCRKFALEDMEGRVGIEQMQNGGISGLSFEWPTLRTGKNSGYQAINLAILLGYKKLILLGYDMQQDNGKVHWFGDHEGPLINAGWRKYREWIEFYKGMIKELPADIEIINATRKTALTCFPRMKLRELF